MIIGLYTTDHVEVARYWLEGGMEKETLIATLATLESVAYFQQIGDNHPLRQWPIQPPRTLLPGDTLSASFSHILVTVESLEARAIDAVRQLLDPTHLMDDLALMERAAFFFAGKMHKGA